MDMYFNQYQFSKAEKVIFTVTKLTGQASQYSTDLGEENKKARFQQPTKTWEYKGQTHH